MAGYGNYNTVGPVLQDQLTQWHRPRWIPYTASGAPVFVVTSATTLTAEVPFAYDGFTWEVVDIVLLVTVAFTTNDCTISFGLTDNTIAAPGGGSADVDYFVAATTFTGGSTPIGTRVSIGDGLTWASTADTAAERRVSSYNKWTMTIVHPGSAPGAGSAVAWLLVKPYAVPTGINPVTGL